MRLILLSARALLLICGSARSAGSAEPFESNSEGPRERGTSADVRRYRTRSAIDGIYDRFDGVWSLEALAGAHADASSAGIAFGGTAHYYSSAGLYATYVDALGSDTALWDRLLSLGIDLRPTFLPRWSQDMQTGPTFLDLAIDSISLGLGVFWAAPAGSSFGEARGFELSLGVGVPLTGGARGPWLNARGILRWLDPGPDGSAARGAGLLTVSWRFFADSPL